MYEVCALLEVVSENDRDMDKEHPRKLKQSVGREEGSPRDVCLQVAARSSKRGS